MTKLSHSGHSLQEKLRQRAQTTVRSPMTLKMKISTRNLRGLVRQLNDDIGMNAYEMVKATPIYKDIVDVEIIVPSKLGLILKLTWGGR